MSISVGGWVTVPLNLLSDTILEYIRKDLTYVSPFPDEETGIRKRIEMFIVKDDTVSVPIEWAKYNISTVYEQAEDERITSVGIEVSKLPDPNHPRVKNPEAQKALMDDLLYALENNYNCLMQAATGSGKTVVALWAAAKLNQRTVILVPTEAIMRQWIAEIQDKLGIPLDRIGIAQQSKCQIEGKDIVVAMMATIANREDDGPFSKLFNWAGFVIADESHRLSTEHLNKVLPKFKAKYRLAMSATPKRKDGSHCVLYNHVGEVSVVGATEVMDAVVHRIPFNKAKPTSETEYAYPERTAMWAIGRDIQRNNFIADLIYELHTKKRQIVIISNSVKHLQLLIKLAIKKGVPAGDIGQFTATKIVDGKSKKVSEQDQAVALKKPYVFATDGMMREAVDEARLDTLVEAMPFWNANQRIGRIRRFIPGKSLPRVFTIIDNDYEITQNMYYARERDYIEAGATIK